MSRRPVSKKRSAVSNKPRGKASRLDSFTRLVTSPLFARGYLIFSALTLLLTTVFLGCQVGAAKHEQRRPVS